MTSVGGTDAIVEHSSSPPGRESRQDWKGEEKDDADRARSRSRSPHSNGKSKQFVYDREGSNTTRDEPHFQRARLFVGNIDHKRIRKTDIVKRFAQYGEVLGASVHKGYAFVQMDREKNANKAINYEHNQLFNGTRINVEFSQAALKAGAKFERLPVRRSPVKDLREKSETYAMLEIEREREDRLARILEMERELNYLRQSREDPYDGSHRRGYERREGYYADNYRKASSPPRDYPPYLRDDHLPLDRPYADRPYGDLPEDRRGYYDRPPSPPLRSGPPSSYRTSPGTVSYPIRGSSIDPDSRGLPTVGAARPLMGIDSRREVTGNRYGPSQLPSQGVGYGSMASKPAASGSGPVSSVPPGWPSADYEKSRGDIASRPPFASAWS